ncbi:adhesion G protein-coupled receptor E1-like [Notolabrus celidotus]|uniref:adhesion G protein-coupled receptor E1-like n=1 Tax=Notolabrus celidotus TaxID=1203425 RepID=UPI0014903C87|nr:adhesion G protein-coupled receptor E1-like [Notolabrus celidotus]
MTYGTNHISCNPDSCGPLAQCKGTGCICTPGYEIPPEHLPTGDSYGCVDINECQTTEVLCDPLSNCINTPGSYLCVCFEGYEATYPSSPASLSNICKDINECLDPNICGDHGVCVNHPGSYVCECDQGYDNKQDPLSVCQDIDEIFPYNGDFVDTRGLILSRSSGNVGCNKTLRALSVEKQFNFYVGRRVKSVNVSSTGDGETAGVILKITELLVSALMGQDLNQTGKTLKSPSVDLSVKTFGPGSSNSQTSALSANTNTMDINLESLAQNNNGSAAVALVVLNGMESLLIHEYFETENMTEMYSDVITATLPSVNNTNLTEPVNFTITHKKMVPDSGLMTCVYWEDKAEDTGGSEGGSKGGENSKMMRWSVEGCHVSYTNENFTVCSCSHLSTFALIMQIGEPPPVYPFLEWLNRICVIVGLFFFALAIFTFLLCSWNPKVNNTAHLHLCLSLALSHLLLLWNDRYTDHKLACTVMAGLLHFLVVASFVWMVLEALQLHMLVQRLSKVQVIRRDGLPRPLLYVIGYGVPFVIVGVSALVYSDGYGATEADVCWLSTRRRFNWALTAPVIAAIGLNWMLFCATLWSLRPTLANMRSNVSQSNDTRLILFKILAQFIILGCTWILGLYQTNLFFQFLFLFLNSQQGTFLFIVHCVLNKEVREEYIKWLTCSFNKQGRGSMQKEVTSVSGNLDKAEEKTK